MDARLPTYRCRKVIHVSGDIVPARPELRMSDSDREGVLARLSAALADGRLTLTEFEERVGNVAAGALPGFFLEEIAPLVYNQAVAEVQQRLGQRVAEVDVEVHEDAFQYWSRRTAKPSGRR